MVVSMIFIFLISLERIKKNYA
jgi:hypothetical protein